MPVYSIYATYIAMWYAPFIMYNVTLTQLSTNAKLGLNPDY